MNKKLIVTLLQKNIDELAMITASFEEQEFYSQAIIQLASRKTEDIHTLLAELAAFPAVDLQPISKVADFELEIPEVILDISENKPEVVFVSDALLNSNDIQATVVDESDEYLAEELKDNEPLLTNIHVDDLPDLTFAQIETEIENEAIEIKEAVDENFHIADYFTIEKPVEVAEETTQIESTPTENVEFVAETFIEVDLPLIETSTVHELSPPAIVTELESKHEESKKMTISEKLAILNSSRNESFAHSDNSLSASIANKKITDIKLAISIGDRFRFQRELFKSNGEDMNRTLTYLNLLATLDEAMSFLKSKYAWDEANETASDFYQLVKRKFA